MDYQKKQNSRKFFVLWNGCVLRVGLKRIFLHACGIDFTQLFYDDWVKVTLHTPCTFFPTCQVRVVRFYQSCPSPCPPSSPRRTSTSAIHPQCLLPDLNHDHMLAVFAAGPQPRAHAPSVRCRTSTTITRAQCSLPDLNHDHTRPVFAAGPQPRSWNV